MGSWRARAACRGVSVGVFYPRRPEEVRRALDICAACEARAECLVAVLAEEAGGPYRFGVRGGTTARERRRLMSMAT